MTLNCPHKWGCICEGSNGGVKFRYIMLLRVLSLLGNETQKRKTIHHIIVIKLACTKKN